MRIHSDDAMAALQEIDAATDRLIRTISGLGPTDLTGPSLLPGWSRAHVITHVARNADSLHNLLSWARTGAEIPQYESGARRDRDIAAGAGRPADELTEDVRASAERFAQAVRTLPNEAWHATVRAWQGWPHPAWYIVFRRWREVEVHHADLDAGYSHADWPEPYVRCELSDTLGWLRARGGPGVARIEATDLGLAVDIGLDTGLNAGLDAALEPASDRPGTVISGSGREVLGWLTGRTDGSALEVTGGDPRALPAAPVWPQAPAIDWDSAAT